ncbi:MAG TPA: glycosyltransferase family 4 protein [Candidatus Methylomirabilis sp.]|nr:glycosyltransferase family 4 protein [Candidatus Methylomirabilis sp.]
MRVLLWSELFWPHIGGSEAAAAALISGLRGRGVEFTVVTRRDPPDLPATLDYEGIPVHRLEVDQDVLDRRDMGTLLALRQRVSAIKQDFRPDLVHVSLPGPTALLHRFTDASCWRAPTLVTLHVPLTPDELRPEGVSGSVTRRADWVVACSESLLAETRAAMPEIAPHSSVIHNGLPMPSLPPAELRVDPPILVCVGRLVRQKGLERAIEALATVRGRCPDARLVVAGDGELREDLEQQARALGVAAAVEFMGWVQPRNVPALLNRASVVVVPSRGEAFGLVALEAAQMARPVVAFNVGGLAEVIADGRTGLLVGEGDTQALAAAILRLLSNPDEAATMGRRAREHAKTFSVARYADAFEALYRRLAIPRAVAG